MVVRRQFCLILLLGCMTAAPVFAADEEGSGAALEAIGGLAVGHVQSTMGFIGVTADAFAKDVYKPAQVEELMTGVVNSIDATKKLLRKLQDTELSDEDEAFVDGLIGVYNALQVEAKALIKFTQSKNAADAEAFEKARKSVVSKYEKLVDADE